MNTGDIAFVPFGSTSTSGTLASITATSANSAVPRFAIRPSFQLPCALLQRLAAPQRPLTLDPRQSRAARACAPRSRSPCPPSGSPRGTHRLRISAPISSWHYGRHLRPNSASRSRTEEGKWAGWAYPCTAAQRHLLPRACCDRGYPPHPPRILQTLPAGKRETPPSEEMRTMPMPMPTLQTGLSNRAPPPPSSTATPRTTTPGHHNVTCLIPPPTAIWYQVFVPPNMSGEGAWKPWCLASPFGPSLYQVP